MRANINQSAIEALDIYERAQSKGRDVLVSDKKGIREVTLFDRFKEGLRSLDSKHKTRDWQAEAREHIKTRLVEDGQLLKPDLSTEAKTALKEMAEEIFSLKPTCSNSWELILHRESTNNTLLADVLTNIKDMKEKVDASIYCFVRPLLQNNNGNLEDAIKEAKLILHLKKEKGLRTEMAKNAANNIHSAMKTFALNFNDAFDLVQFSGHLVHTGKISLSKESIENAYIIKTLMEKCNVSQVYALQQRSNVLAVMRRDKIDIKEAVDIIARRIKVLPEINSGLPKNMAISPADDIFILSQELPGKFRGNVLDDFKKLSVKNVKDLEKLYEQFDTDVKRMVISTKKSADPTFRSAQDVITDLKRFAANDPSLTSMLTRLLNQTALAGLAVNAWFSVPLASGDVMNAAPDNSFGKQHHISTSIFELSAEGSDDIFLDCTYLMKSHLLIDAKGKQWEMNRGPEWEGDVNDRNCGQRLKLKLKFSRNELKQGISNPQIVKAPTIECLLQPAWDIIDADLEKESKLKQPTA